MMTPEERRRFIEEEKAHLRKLRALNAAARNQSKLAGTRQRLADMVNDARKTLETHDEFRDKLDRETAVSEAKVELALEQQSSAYRRADRLVAQLAAEGSESEDAPMEDRPVGKTPKTIGRMSGDRASSDETG